MRFADHFSGHASDYARFRPVYPAELFSYLAGVAERHILAWDCGTGNGQAAVALSAHFAEVFATDPSAKQLAQVLPASNVCYAVAAAEAVPLASDSVDLITVAQALHWFDLARFYDEVRRVLRRGGVLAAWGYGLTRVSPAVDSVIDHYYRDVVGLHWPPERRLIDQAYRSIDFPFAEMAPPAFVMEQQWSLHDFVGYLGTWSAAQRYQRVLGRNPLESVYPELLAAWGEADAKRRVVWPLFMRVGRSVE